VKGRVTMMKSLGIYNAENGKRYELFYYEESHLAIAIRIPDAEVGVGRVSAEIQVTSEEDARRKLEEKLRRNTS
jgi:hypothetical protein